MAGNTAKAQEPTMEEILASIRRIISDDDAGTKDDDANMEGLEAGAELGQDDIDAVFSSMDAAPAVEKAAAPAPAPVVAEAPRPTPSRPRAVELPVQDPPHSVSEDDKVLELVDEVSTTSPVLAERVEIDDEMDTADVEFRDPSDMKPVAAAPAPVMRTEASRAASMSGLEGLSTRLSEDAGRLISPQVDDAVTQAFGSLAHTILSQNARTLEDLVQDMLRPLLRTWLDDNLPGMVERLVREEIERVSRGGRR